MLARRWLTRALLSAAILASLYLLLGDSREKRVLRVLRELAAAVSDQPGDTERQKAERIQSAGRRHLSPAFVFFSPELGALEGEETRELLGQAPGLGVSVTIDQSDVRFHENGRARASLLVELVHRPSGEERREWRNAEAVLTERAGAYRLERLDVSAPIEREPEPRP